MVLKVKNQDRTSVFFEKTKFQKYLHRMARHWQLYILILPALVYIIVFNYTPIYGIIIAFKNYKPYLGYWGSDWVGLQNFTRFLNSAKFKEILPNTILLSLYQLFAGFPLPIILALCLNYISSLKYKKLVQNITYAPYFISTVVVIGMLNVFFAQSTGLVNNVIAALGGERVMFLGDASKFRDLYVWSGIWTGTGWSSIIYIAALSSVDTSLHEAAIIDGATIIQRIRHIDIPAIMSTIVILFVMNTGKIMSVGFEKAYLMQNNLNITTSEIISTYVYKIGLLNHQYSYSTAIDLFNSVVNLILVLTVNTVSKKLSDASIW